MKLSEVALGVAVAAGAAWLAYRAGLSRGGVTVGADHALTLAIDPSNTPPAWLVRQLAPGFDKAMQVGAKP